MRYLALLTAILAAPAVAQADPATTVSEERLRADVETMVGFGTRHTLSSQTDPARGIGAAIDWGMAEFSAISAACAGCLTTLIVADTVSGDRITDPVLIRNAVAMQIGGERPNEVIIIQGHIDSRGSDVMDADIDAPGANDNASGSALVLEAARALSQSQYPTTIVYALLSGEEQGLYGGTILADYALAQGWTVKAVLNNDIVGGSCGSDGYCDAAQVRVFSEGVRADADERMRARMESQGGGNDSPSRNLSRWLKNLAQINYPLEQYPDDLDVLETWRSDRVGRGGDHLPFLDRGLPAVRLTAAVEDYDHQHQDVRVEGGAAFGDTADEMDFAYLAAVTRLNVRAADQLLRAPMPPRLEISGIMEPAAQLRVERAQGAACQVIVKRPTSLPDWQFERQFCWADFPTIAVGDKLTLDMTPDRIDDWFFGVVSVAADGAESPAASAVPGGDFYPLGTRD